MNDLEVLVVGVMTVGLVALGGAVVVAVVAALLARRLIRYLTDELVLPLRAAVSGDADVRRVAALRREIRRSVVATEQAQAYARAAGVSGETVRLATRVTGALRAADRDLVLAQRDPDQRVRHELAAGSAAQVERLLAASGRLRALLATGARAAVPVETSELERDVAVEERLAGEWAAVHRGLAAGPAAL